ncbi:hypothetical protein, partial [Halomonas sp.]|uniref:hypothetical protein n=1 Tax=Halomonas sp. TaxID=1486246 RepID=UPI0023560A29
LPWSIWALIEKLRILLISLRFSLLDMHQNPVHVRTHVQGWVGTQASAKIKVGRIVQRGNEVVVKAQR